MATKQSSKRIGREAWSAALAGALGILLMFGLYIAQPGLLTRLDLKIYDHWLPLAAASAPSPVPAIIDLDEASLAAYGQWPWPRYLLADLLTALAEYGTAAVGLDILLAEADRSSPNRLMADLERHRGLELALSGLPPELGDYDQLLAETLAGVPAVLGGFAYFKEEGPDGPWPPALRIIERERPGARPFRDLLPPALSAVLPLELFLGQTPLGFINATVDPDGVVREIPLIVRRGEEIYPALSLRALMLGLGVDSLTLVSGPYGLETVQVGGYAARVSPRGGLRLPFIGPRRTYPYFSAVDVLERKVNPEELQGRVVFLGSSAPGLMDLKATPHDRAYPAVEAHAVALDALITGNAPTLPPWAPAFQVIGVSLAGLLAALAFALIRPRAYPPVAVFLGAAAIMVSRRLFVSGLFLSPLYALLSIALEGAVFLLWRFRREEKRKFDLEIMVAKKNQEVVTLQNAVLNTVADLVEFRDKFTGGHITRTQFYLKALSVEMIRAGNEEMSGWDMDFFLASAQLHDVGKIAIPDLILNKPGKLTDEEFEIMKTHVTVGVEAIERIIKNTKEHEFLRHTLGIAGAHHEKWDGGGYPLGLKGQNIPLEGRLMAVADVYDALISERPYKKAFTHEEACQIIEVGARTHFDPALVEVFLKVKGEFARIAREAGALKGQI